jgi:hypothetical protein
MLLHAFTATSSFHASVSVISSHALLSNLLLSLLLDQSSTLCSLTLSLMCKLLPSLVANSSNCLKPLLPMLLAVLGRVICWKERDFPPSSLDSMTYIEGNESAQALFLPASQINWHPLELSFHAASSPPDSNQYFTILYYLYPANMLKFISHPITYLLSHDVKSVYAVEWSTALDELKIRVYGQVCMYCGAGLFKLFIAAIETLAKSCLPSPFGLLRR